MSNSQKRPNSNGSNSARKKGAGAKRPGVSNVVSNARKSAPGGRRSQQTTFAIVAAVVAIAAIVGGIIAINRASEDKATTAAATDAKSVQQLKDGVQKIAAEVPANFPQSQIKPDAIVIGNDSAPVTVDMWIDLQCPACKLYEAQAESTLEQEVLAGTVVLKMHPVAILDRMSTTNYSSRAGNAVVCAADQGKYTAYANALYAYQPDENTAGLTNDKLMLIGEAAGLDEATFKTCVNDSAQTKWIDSSTQAFKDKNLPGTPSVFVNGTQMQKGTLDELKAAIAAAE